MAPRAPSAIAGSRPHIMDASGRLGTRVCRGSVDVAAVVRGLLETSGKQTSEDCLRVEIGKPCGKDQSSFEALESSVSMYM
ncbi:hypothetical protein O3P69_011922 [Scylla paramamosain]|uniref:Uncharacterized protein n=1 Tax=Scylla paramamosain TaxID=85552 RepID=A0AAW0SIW2_SCYPA